jgi:hypothetical protein
MSLLVLIGLFSAYNRSLFYDVTRTVSLQAEPMSLLVATS